MAQKIVKDSNLAIFVKEVPVPQATAIGDFVIVGSKRGFAGETPRLAEDGLYYTTVDTAALVRIDNISGAFTDGQPVYMTPGLAPTATASGNTFIGYADRAKSAAAGKLFVQLIPSA